MKTDPITVSPELSIRELVDDFVYKYHFKMFPVVQDSKLLGCISTNEVRELARDEWERLRVGDSRMVVRENDRLIGIVSLKFELEGRHVRGPDLRKARDARSEMQPRRGTAIKRGFHGCDGARTHLLFLPAARGDARPQKP